MSAFRVTLTKQGLLKFNFFNLTKRLFATEGTAQNNNIKDADGKSGGYAKAFTKFESLQHETNPELPKTFAHLLRHSKFIDVSKL